MSSEKIEAALTKETLKNDKPYFFPRLVAYIIDVTLVSIVCSGILFLFPKNENYSKYLKEYQEVQTNFIDNKIEADEYIHKVADITYDIDYSNVLSMIVEVVLLILYFIVFQFYNKGQTFGKKLMKLRVVNNNGNELTLNQVTCRALIIDSILINLFMIAALLFSGRNYYYYGTQEGLTTDEAVTARIDVLGDYIGSELTADESTMESDGCKKKAIEELTSYNGTNLFATENDGKKEKTLRDGKYTIYTTNTFNNPNEEIVIIGQTKSIAYKVSRLLAVNTDTMKYTNDVEILQYSGYSQNKDRTENTYNRVKDTTPGNLVPGGAMEDDEDSVRTTITPPTGTIISRWLYVTTVAAGLILVGATIIFIRKRVLVK